MKLSIHNVLEMLCLSAYVKVYTNSYLYNRAAAEATWGPGDESYRDIPKDARRPIPYRPYYSFYRQWQRL